MICERCKRKEATVHLTEIIRNEKSEIHLCENCANEIRLNSKSANFTFSIPEVLSFLDFDDGEENYSNDLCKTCGFTYLDYKKKKVLGCSDCYDNLKFVKDSIISCQHNEKRHIGKMPANFNLPKDNDMISTKIDTVLIDKIETLSELQNNLQTAIFEERYEDAAEIRDRIQNKENVS